MQARVCARILYMSVRAHVIISVRYNNAHLLLCIPPVREMCTFVLCIFYALFARAIIMRICLYAYLIFAHSRLPPFPLLCRYIYSCDIIISRKCR